MYERTAQNSRHSEITVAKLAIINERVMDLESGQPFDGHAYSLYKYGCGEAANDMALSVTDKLLVERDNILESEGEDILDDYYITSSAYKHVPTAAYYVTRRMVGELASAGFPPKGLVRIDRSVIKSGDYSTMSEADRKTYIEDNNVHVPTVYAKDVANKTVIVFDDVRNTGSNERSFAAALTDAGVGRMVFCYAAVIDPELAARYPKIESDLNQVYVTGLSELEIIAKRSDFEVNARICRFIMDAAHTPEQIHEFVANVPYANARAILAGVVSDGHHTRPEYFENFTALQQSVRQRRIQQVAEKLAPTHLVLDRAVL